MLTISLVTAEGLGCKCATMDVILKSLFSSEAEELYILEFCAYFMLFMTLVTFVTLLFENVPYGRYASSRYGFPVNVKLAWFVQELPAILVPVCLVFFTSASRTSYLPNQLLLCMYFCHYIQRYDFSHRRLAYIYFMSAIWIWFNFLLAAVIYRFI